MGTVITLPLAWIKKIDINAWFESKGHTVGDRVRDPDTCQITIAETLNDGQITALETFINLELKPTPFSVKRVGE